MRFFTIVLLVFFANWIAPNVVRAEQSNSCKQCTEQRRACASNYSAKTCKTEYDLCMKSCRQK